MRNLIGLAVVGILIASCGPAQETPKASGGKLYEAVGQAILVVDSKSHAVERRLPLGTPSPDWRHLYTIVADSLVDTNPLTGATQNTLLVGPRFQLPAATNTGLPGGLSRSGAWLVLESYDSSTTRMVVVDTATFKVTDAFGLPGRFNFDAISDDGVRMYLIQYLNGKEYYVRLFNLLSNSLDANIVVDKSDGNQAMAGLRLSGIATPDGSMLLSMYVRESESPFIHALNLSGPFAFCLDLPGSGYSQWSLAMNAAGSRLYAVGGPDGLVAELDSSNQYAPQLMRTARLGAGADAALLSPDGKSLVTGGASGLVWIDTSSLRVSTRSLSEWHVWSLALAPDGKTMFAVNDAGAVAEISMASGAVVERFDPATGRPIALMRVASS